MNIYELEKQATPGPFSAVANRPEENGGKLDRVKAQDGSNVIFIPDHEHTYEQEQSDALLFVHCRNNFMKALEGWKAEHQRFMDELFDEKGFFHNPDCPICRQIKELEEVS